MKKKFIVLASSLLVVSLLFVISSQKAYASCECLRDNAPIGVTSYDNQGLVIPAEAYGIWTTTPITAVNPADQEPRCPTNTLGGPGCTYAPVSYTHLL